MKISTTIVVSCAAIALSGCAAQRQLHGVAIDYNDMVAETSDELTLLNVVRAAHRYPMHFTTVSSLRGNASFSGSLGAGASFPGTNVSTNAGGTSVSNEGNDFSSSVGISASSSPSFDVAVLNTEKFQRGIMDPVPASLVDSYIAQGWPDDLIAALFIERITFYDAKGNRLGVLDNDPGHAKGACFLNFILRHELVPTRESSEDTRLVAWSAVQGNSSLSDIKTLDGSSYDIDKDQQIVRKGKSSLVLRADHVSDGESVMAQGGALAAAVSNNCTSGLSPAAGAEGLFSVASEGGDDGASDIKVLPAGNPGAAGGGTFAKAVITFRSIQGAFYFLGEVARPGIGLESEPFPYRLRDGSSVFRLHPGAGRAITAKFRGARFGIDDTNGGANDRSLQVIDLLQQVLNLQKSADQLPATRTVNIVP